MEVQIASELSFFLGNLKIGVNLTQEQCHYQSSHFAMLASIQICPGAAGG
jgi:hypothetical protein